MTRSRCSSWNGAPIRPSGVALIFVLALVAVLAVAGIALIRFAGSDRVDAARLGRKDRGLVCAEAGLQYARRFFGACFTSSNNWNSYLSGAAGFENFQFIKAPTDPDNVSPSVLAAAPLQTRGASDGASLDPGSDLDGDGQPDFWVSIRDDADEVSAGQALDDPTRDNNGMVVIRSECTNPAYQLMQGGTGLNRVIEATIAFSNQSAMATAGSGNAVCQVGGSAGGTAPSGISTNAGARGNNL